MSFYFHDHYYLFKDTEEKSTTSGHYFKFIPKIQLFFPTAHGVFHHESELNLYSDSSSSLGCRPPDIFPDLMLTCLVHT